MAKENVLSSEDVAKLAVVSASTPGNSATNPVQSALMEALLEDLVERKQKKTEAERQEKASREANIANVKLQEQQKLGRQAECPHKKPNGHPAIAGQRDHRQHYHWICLYCQKEWIDNKLPIDLRISMDRVGGPNN